METVINKVICFRIYKQVNYADTCRDADDIRVTEISYKNKLEDAIVVANNYIRKNFFHKDTELHKCKDSNNYQATDFCSYGETIYIEEINID